MSHLIHFVSGVILLFLFMLIVAIVINWLCLWWTHTHRGQAVIRGGQERWSDTDGGEPRAGQERWSDTDGGEPRAGQERWLDTLQGER